jgi:glucose-1-phosphate thymidylyltransferase|tara:strand:+ start:1231 stop:1986 length:756 start_codon:yes stop_codon:yes gene_type:complete
MVESADLSDSIGVLLCGGKGERMTPFTLTNNKVMLRIGKKILLDLHIEALVKSDIKKIIVICNPHVDAVMKHIQEMFPELDVEYIIEYEPIGSINALKLARDQLEGKNVYLRFGDNFTSFNYSKSINDLHATRDSKKGAIIFTKYDNQPQFYGVCDFNEDGELIQLIEKPNPSPSNIVLGGIYYFDSDFVYFLDKLSTEEGNSIIDILNYYHSESIINAFRVNQSGWIDCGTPEGLAEARLFQKENDRGLT